MNIDNAVFVQRAKVNGFFGKSGKFAHLNICATNQIDIL